MKIEILLKKDFTLKNYADAIKRVDEYLMEMFKKHTHPDDEVMICMLGGGDKFEIFISPKKHKREESNKNWHEFADKQQTD